MKTFNLDKIHDTPVNFLNEKNNFKDDWRYVPTESWRLNKLIQSRYYSGFTEDKEEGEVESLIDWLEDNIEDKRISSIIYDYMYEGKSMVSIGEELKLSRVRVWQLYQKGLAQMREQLTESEFKTLFITGRKVE